MSAIHWTDRARDDLADVYVRTPSDRRDGVERAVREVEQYLSENGAGAGESRADPFRVYIHPVLVVFFKAVPFEPTTLLRVRPTRWRDG